MAEIAAIPVARIEGATPTKDGGYLLIGGREPDGTELVLAIAADQLLALMDLAASGHTNIGKIKGRSPDEREVHKVTRWELGDDPVSGRVLLSLTFGSGGRLDFGLPNPIPMGILETLQLRLGSSSPVPPRTGLS